MTARDHDQIIKTEYLRICDVAVLILTEKN